MTTYAKRKLKYSRKENFNLLHCVKWDRFVTLAGSKSGLRVTLDFVFENCFLSCMTPYVDSRDGRSLSLYGSESQIWKTFTTICTAIDSNKDIS
jgi:hypothetical protein